MLETLFQRLQEWRCHTVPVTRGGALVGPVTSENIGEFLMIQAALRTSSFAGNNLPQMPTAS